MLFKNYRSYIPTQQLKKNPLSNMNFTSKINPVLTSHDVRMHTPQQVSVAKQTPHIVKVEAELRSKKITWGEPFWNLFHVLAENVKQSEFDNIRVDLLNIIYTICSNLPCPDCTKHAMNYLHSINFNSIQTKEQLKNVLFNFHNSVNVRKGFLLFPRNELDEKYKKANTLLVIETFLNTFSKKQRNSRLMTDDIYRDRITKTLVTWFQTNISVFD